MKKKSPGDLIKYPFYSKIMFRIESLIHKNNEERLTPPEVQCPETIEQQGRLDVRGADFPVCPSVQGSGQTGKSAPHVSAKKTPWPKTLPAQVRILRSVLAASPAPTESSTCSKPSLPSARHKRWRTGDIHKVRSPIFRRLLRTGRLKAELHTFIRAH
jgi:hypothetical protein